MPAGQGFDDPTQHDDEDASQRDLLDSLLGGSRKRSAPDGGLPGSSNHLAQTQGPSKRQIGAMHAGTAADASAGDHARSNGGLQGSSGSDDQTHFDPNSPSEADRLGTAHEHEVTIGHEEGQEPGQEQEEEAPQLTQTLQEGSAEMIHQLRSIEAKIQELTQLGVNELDAIKARFIAEMTRTCEELRALCAFHQANWADLAAATIQESKRLDMARNLVGHLGAAAVGDMSDGHQQGDGQ